MYKVTCIWCARPFHRPKAQLIDIMMGHTCEMVQPANASDRGFYIQISKKPGPKKTED
jgi:hypothetical protein